MQPGCSDAGLRGEASQQVEREALLGACWRAHWAQRYMERVDIV